jgi:hypothetical protein
MHLISHTVPGYLHVYDIQFGTYRIPFFKPNMSKRITHQSFFTHKKIMHDLCIHVCSLHGIKTLADPDSWNRDPDPDPDPRKGTDDKK